MGIFADERIDQLADPLPTQVGRAGQADGALQIAVAVLDDVIEGVDFFKNLQGIFKQQLPFGGGAQASGIALEQA
ncbi:hypothetical protein D3C86_1657240 [compost metagenome]